MSLLTLKASFSGYFTSLQCRNTFTLCVLPSITEDIWHMQAQNISGDCLPAFCLNSWSFIIFSKLLNFIWTSWIALLLLFASTSSHIDVHYSFYVCLNFLKISHLVTLPLGSKATVWLPLRFVAVYNLSESSKKKAPELIHV